MKRNKKIWLHIVLPTFAFIILLSSSCVLFFGTGLFHNYWGSDLILRQNEINCAHEGIDSFDIFEEKITSEKYFRIPRPDKPNDAIAQTIREKKENGQKTMRVHAYPPWHTALFWWYGFVSQNVCISIMLIVYLCSLIWICKWTAEHLQEKDRINYTADILFILAMCIYPFLGICHMNYGLLLTACALLLFTLLKRKQEVYAGFVYSLIMIKPQIGVLFLIPLFINKYYKTIAIAGVICILETLFTAWKLDKSPIELILQLPKIGAPFSSHDFFGRTATTIFGTPGPFISKGVFIAIALTGSLFVRNAKDIWVRFLPAIAMIPFWVYTQFHDWFILLPCYIYIFNNRQNHPRLYDLCFCLLFPWSIVTFFRIRECYSIGKQGFASFLLLAIVSISYFMAIFDTKEVWNMKFLKRKQLDPVKSKDNE